MNENEKKTEPAEEQKPAAGKRAGKKAAAKRAAERGGYCVYLGPGIRGVIAHGKVLRGTKSQAVEQLARAIGAYPQIESLVIPAGELAEARRKLENGGSLLARLDRELRAAARRGEKTK